MCVVGFCVVAALCCLGSHAKTALWSAGRGSGRQEAGELAAGVGLAGILSRTHAHKNIINCACAAKKERKREQQEVEWMREGGTRGTRSKCAVNQKLKIIIKSLLL